MVSASQNPDRLPLLDGLRTVAAFGVLLYHAPSAFGFSAPVGRMYLLVDLFFMLSGFVLTLSAESKMRLGLSAIGFVRLRIDRLWPMVALGSLLGAGAFLIKVPTGQVFTLLAWSLALLPLISSPVAIFPLNTPLWSIFWEIVANFLHAAFLHRLTDWTLLIVTAVSGMGLVVAINYVGWAGFGPNGQMWWLAFLRIAWSYPLGVWFGRRWIAKRPRPLVGWLGSLLLPLLALVFLSALPLTLSQGDALFLIIILPGLFWLAVSAVPPKSTERALRSLGSLSFPLYAVHAPIFFIFRFLSNRSEPRVLAVLTAIGFAAVVSSVSPEMRRRWNVFRTKASRLHPPRRDKRGPS